MNSMYSMHGRDPTDQQRSWLVSKIRTDIAMMEINLNLQNMHEKSLPPTGLGARKRMELEYQDWARLQGKGPQHRRTQRPPSGPGVADVTVVESRDGQ
jgi:hypothetical protein